MTKKATKKATDIVPISHNGVNADVTREGSCLTIRINLAERNGLSSTGSSEIVGSTRGNMMVPFESELIRVGVNAYVKN